ncbi:MAG TPA: SRPBCC domain-containing protein, partial [Saprospiraceae bacterium]|nr:SRPBCC domain-containing protein [Saprospiraceae bacterium]
MDKDLKVSKSITINATAEQVWDALVNPEKIKKYLFGTEA